MIQCILVYKVCHWTHLWLVSASNTWKVGGSSGEYKGIQLTFSKIFGT